MGHAELFRLRCCLTIAPPLAMSLVVISQYGSNQIVRRISDAQLQHWELILYGTEEPVGPNGGTSGAGEISLSLRYSDGWRLVSWFRLMLVPLALMMFSSL